MLPKATLHAGVALLALAAIARGAPDEPTAGVEEAAWWERAEAREEGARVLREVARLIRTSERGDARPACEALRDPAWVVRRLAIVRLELLGLPPEVCRALLARARPGSEPPLPDTPALEQAAAFAEARRAEPMKLDPVSPGDAARAVADLTAQALAEEAPPREKRRALEALLTLPPALPEPEQRAELARGALTLLDRAILRELGAREPEAALARGGRAVLRWLAANAPYLYWHPAGMFRVDHEARAAKRPTEEHRKQHPWPPGEGPAAR